MKYDTFVCSYPVYDVDGEKKNVRLSEVGNECASPMYDKMNANQQHRMSNWRNEKAQADVKA